MQNEMLHYECVNSETGNVIAYFSLPVTMTEKERNQELEKKKIEVAVENKIYVALIYWR